MPPGSPDLLHDRLIRRHPSGRREHPHHHRNFDGNHGSGCIATHGRNSHTHCLHQTAPCTRCNNYCNLHADQHGSNDAARTASAGTKQVAAKTLNSDEWIDASCTKICVQQPAQAHQCSPHTRKLRCARRRGPSARIWTRRLSSSSKRQLQCGTQTSVLSLAASLQPNFITSAKPATG